MINTDSLIDPLLHGSRLYFLPVVLLCLPNKLNFSKSNVRVYLIKFLNIHWFNDIIVHQEKITELFSPPFTLFPFSRFLLKVNFRKI